MSVQRLPDHIALPTDGALHVTGLVAQPLRLTRDELKANYAATTQQGSFVDSDLNQTITAAFTGALVYDVLNGAQVRFNPDVKDDLLRFYVTVTAQDGYQTLLSWGELAPGFGEQPALIAYAQDSAALGELRLIVPGDAKGGRNVKQVVSLDVRRAPAAY